MPIVNSYRDFEKYWKKDFFSLCDIKIYTQSSIIRIIEKDKNGKGEIYLDFRNLNTKNFVVELLMSEKNNSKCIRKPKNCDGVLLRIDINNKLIDIYLIELKTTLTHKIEEANEQIRNAYWFISGLNLYKCFKINFKVILAYKNFNETSFLSMKKSINKKNSFKQALYSFNETSKFPIMLPFCKYIELKIELLKFNEKKVV